MSVVGLHSGSGMSIMDSGIDLELGCFTSLIDDVPTPTRIHDPLLTLPGRISPTDFGKYDPDQNQIDFTSPAKMFIEDTLNSNITPFIDAVPETMLDSLNSSNAYSPSSLAGDENPFEVFQDLRHTSTPKQSVSVVEPPRVEFSQARKRIKFSGGANIVGKSRSWHVLHDITSQNILQHDSDSFIKITDISCKKRPSETPNPETPIIRKVPILRGNSRKKTEKINLTCVDSARQSQVKAFLYPPKNPSVREQDKWLYYTGFTNYELMYRVLSHISVPPEEGLTSFQILIMTLMRLKCDLDWRDLSHRFDLFEPTVYSLFHSTLTLLSYSLSDTIAWTLPPAPRSKITVFLYPLPFRSNDSLMNIFIFITDSRCPILYVSEPLPSVQDPLTLIPSLSRYFMTDDLICIKGMSLKNNPTFLKISKSAETLSYSFVESKNSLTKLKFLKSCQETLRSMRQYKLLLSKIPTGHDNMKKIASVVCCLINLRSSENVSDSVLKNIHKRSYKAPCINQPFK